MNIAKLQRGIWDDWDKPAIMDYSNVPASVYKFKRGAMPGGGGFGLRTYLEVLFVFI